MGDILARQPSKVQLPRPEWLGPGPISQVDGTDNPLPEPIDPSILELTEGREEPLPNEPAWFGGLVEDWAAALARKGRAQKTIDTYRWILRDLGAWLAHCRVEQPEHLIPTVLYAWQDRLRARGLSPSGQAAAVTASRGLLRWAARERRGVPPTIWDHLESVQLPETLPRALWPDQLAAILAHYARAGRRLEELRDRALFLFLLTTGCRIAEALQVDRQDLVVSGRMVVRKKGGAEHQLVPSAKARAWLQDYDRARGRDEQPALWIRVGPRGRHRLTKIEANDIWTELCQQLGLERFTSHVIRHTAVTELGERGASDTEISKLVGWKSNAMAQRYRDVRTNRRQQLVDQLDDLVPDIVTPSPGRRRRPQARVIGGRRHR